MASGALDGTESIPPECGIRGTTSVLSVVTGLDCEICKWHSIRFRRVAIQVCRKT